LAFTDNSAFYGAIQESGINRLAQIAMQQRPSLFNYATPNIVANPTLLPRPLNVDPEVARSGNPMMTVLAPLPIVGSGGYGLDYCVQLAIARVDFAPGNAIALPRGLGPLGPQQLAAQIEVNGGLACPTADIIDTIVAHLAPVVDLTVDSSELVVATVIPTTALQTFRVDAFVVLGATVAVAFGGLEVTSFPADPVAAVVECYLNLVTQLAVLPRLKALIPMTIHYALKNSSGDVALPLAFHGAFTPSPANVPHNPAIEDDQLKVYFDLTVAGA
jgi:hypothetical protein